MIEIIIEYISIWLPSLVSIFGIVGTVLAALSKTKSAMEEFKKDDTLKTLSQQLANSAKENQEIREQYDILIDELKKIKDYRENKK
jgi:uncharacterized coiled-coil protein SlyX